MLKIVRISGTDLWNGLEVNETEFNNIINAISLTGKGSNIYYTKDDVSLVLHIPPSL